MLDRRLASAHFILAVVVMLWSSGKAFSVDIATEASEFGAAGLQSPPTGREEKSATDLAAKLLLLDELVSLENDVYETKKKRSFPGFGSPLDRLSAGSVEHKGKQSYKLIKRREPYLSTFEDWVYMSSCPWFKRTELKVVDHSKKQRFGIPMDRIGRNRLSSSRG